MGKGRKVRQEEERKKLEEELKEDQEELVRLKEELETNEEILKKNLEDTKGQIQQGLYKKGLPQGGMMYDSLIEQMKLNIEEEEMLISAGFEVLTPAYEFQKSSRWKEIQMIKSKKALINMKNNLEEVEKQVAEVTNKILLQNDNIKSRNPLILELINKLEGKTSKPNYIG